MRRKKSNLDEMQEQELLKVEHNGCWIAFWGLLAAIYITLAVPLCGIGFTISMTYIYCF